MDPSPTDIAYFAGILDGEGCLRVGRYRLSRKRKDGIGFGYRSTITVSMTDVGVVEWISKTFGGNWYTSEPRGISKPVAHWTANGARAAELAALCLPYLKAKRQQAELLIEFAGLLKPHGQRLADEGERNERERIAARSTALNKKGS